MLVCAIRKKDNGWTDSWVMTKVAHISCCYITGEETPPQADPRSGSASLQSELVCWGALAVHSSSSLHFPPAMPPVQLTPWHVFT